METSTILTIGLLGIWCSMCVDDKDTSDQRMLGYALGFGLLFILVCKNLYSEEDEEDEEDDECSIYEYASNQTPDEGFFCRLGSFFDTLFGKFIVLVLILVIIVLIVNAAVTLTEYYKEKEGRKRPKDGALLVGHNMGDQVFVESYDGYVVIDGTHRGRIVDMNLDARTCWDRDEALTKALSSADEAVNRAKDILSTGAVTPAVAGRTVNAAEDVKKRIKASLEVERKAADAAKAVVAEAEAAAKAAAAKEAREAAKAAKTAEAVSN